jgi:ParB family transcriptional regulator, chromosome partitioning protein
MSRDAARARSGASRTSLYDEITTKIIAELEAGRVPWVQPWGTTAAKSPLAQVAPTDAEAATAEALRAEYDRLEQTYADADELPEEADQRLGEIETALAALEERPVKYDPTEVGRAGAFVTIDGAGTLRVERGYVRAEDEPVVSKSEPRTDPDSGAAQPAAPEGAQPGGNGTTAQEEPDEDEGVKPIPDRLMTELTAYRTLALRDALGQNWDVAFSAALHTLCLKLFYRYATDSCVEIEVKSVVFGNQAPGLNDTAIAKAVDDGHRRWAQQLPREPGDLWSVAGTRRRQPSNAVRTLRRAQRQCGSRVVESASACSCSRRPARRSP